MNTKKKIAIALAVLMVFALVAPATAEYVAENKKMNIYKQGAGDLTYTYGALSVPCPDGKGKPYYCCIWGHDSSDSNAETATYNIDPSSLLDVVDARLYVYWTWSTVDVCDHIKYGESSSRDYATYPKLEVEFNGEAVSFDYAEGTNWIDHYTDSKNISAVGLQYNQPGYVSWNFPAGTNCAVISINNVSTSNVVNVTNVHPYQVVDTSYCTYPYNVTSANSGRARVCIQGVGLLLTLGDDSKTYWIAEGNDMTYVRWYKGAWKYGIDPEMAITKVKFPGASPMNTGTLTSVVPAGDLGCNMLYFNALSRCNCQWPGLWSGVPDDNLAVSVTNVSDCLRSHNNMARFQNGLWDSLCYPYPNCGDKQMNVANAFLVVE